MTQTQARMAKLHTKQYLEEPPPTLLSTKTQVGTFTDHLLKELTDFAVALCISIALLTFKIYMAV